MIKSLRFLFKISICLLLFTHSITSSGQDVHGDPDVWFLLLNNYKINEKWSVGNELHMRYTDYLSSKQQLLERPFVNYHFNSKVTATAGYTFINTWPYGDFPLPTEKPENNVWEQINLKQTINKWVIQHRYRLEQRWQGDLVQQSDGTFMVDGYTFSQRFRYRLTVTVPLSEKYFINAFDEIWLRSESSREDIHYDRNWVYVGLGYHISSLISIQTAFLHQYIQNNPARYERHSGVQFTALINLN